MNKVKFEGSVLRSGIIFIPGSENVSVCHIVLKHNVLACIPVFCFGEMAVEVKKKLKDKDIVYVSGKIVTYVFHDDLDTPKSVTMILAREIKVNNLIFANTNFREDQEESCLKYMRKNNLLPVPEEDYEIIIKELNAVSW